MFRGVIRDWVPALRIGQFGLAAALSVAVLAPSAPASAADRRGGVIADIAVGANPLSAAVSSDGRLLVVASFGDSTVSVIDTELNRVESTIPVGQSPRAVLISPDGSRAFTANQDSDSVSVIDLNGNAVIATIAVGGSPEALALNPVQARLYVVNKRSETISIVDTTSLAVMKTLQHRGISSSIAVSPDNETLYADNLFSQAVDVLDATSGQVIRSIPMARGYRVQGLALSINGDTLFVTTHSAGTNGVSTIDTATWQRSDGPSIAGAWGVATSQNPRQAYTANGRSVAVVTQGSTPGGPLRVRLIRTPETIWNLAAAPDGKRLYGLDSRSGMVRIIDPLLTVPGATTSVKAVMNGNTASISWLVPRSGGEPTSYSVVAVPGGRQCETQGLSCEIAGLNGKRTYVFVVRAQNAMGKGPSKSSQPTRNRRPSVPPPAPTPSKPEQIIG